MTPPDETSLAVGLAGVQSTLTAHEQRFDSIDGKLDRQDGKLDRQDGKLDKVIDRIDVVYPELASLKTQVREHERRLSELSRLVKGVIAGVIITAIGLVGDAIWAGYIRFGK